MKRNVMTLLVLGALTGCGIVDEYLPPMAQMPLVQEQQAKAAGDPRQDPEFWRRVNSGEILWLYMTNGVARVLSVQKSPDDENDLLLEVSFDKDKELTGTAKLALRTFGQSPAPRVRKGDVLHLDIHYPMIERATGQLIEGITYTVALSR